MFLIVVFLATVLLKAELLLAVFLTAIFLVAELLVFATLTAVFLTAGPLETVFFVFTVLAVFCFALTFFLCLTDFPCNPEVINANAAIQIAVKNLFFFISFLLLKSVIICF